MRRWRLWLLGLLVTGAALYFIFSQIDLAALWRAFTGARYVYVIPCVLLLTIGLYTRALRWRALLGGALPIGRAFSILNVAYLVNGVLPLRLGELARAFLAQRANPAVPIARALSTVVVERLLDLLSVIGLITLAASVALPPELRAAALALAPLTLAGLIVLVIMAAQRERSLRLIGWIVGRLPLLHKLRLDRIAADVLDGLAPLAQPSAFLRIVGWTVVSWALSVAGGYVLMYAFWETADWAATALLIAAASLAIAVPAVPGSVGPFEASIVLALGAFPAYAQPLESATAFALVVHGVTVLLYAVMGVIGLLQEGVSLAQLRAGVGDMRADNPPNHR